MEIEKIARQALQIIKDQWGLPKSGFLAGGSIANIMWEIISGNKAIVNDIDIFIYDGRCEKLDSNKFNYEKKDFIFYEDYRGFLATSIETSDFYTIERSEKNNIFNYVHYKSPRKGIDLIIDSFDINCTKIGYSIEDDSFYWTKDFERFLNTGELAVSNVTTPAHTTLRLVKKESELNAKLNDFELQVLQCCISNFRLSDTIKLRFKDRYFQMFNQYKNRLENFFQIERDTEVENYMLEYHKIDTGSLYKLVSNENIWKDDKNVNLVYTSKQFLFYMKNISNDDKLKNIWSKLHQIFENENYIDCDVSENDISLLYGFINYAPGSIRNFRGLKISEQLELIKTFLNKYADDPIVAISVLENLKIDKNIELDESTLLVLELSVRKKIIDNPMEKVKKIIGEMPLQKIK
jgi:hypothetical protein